MISNNEVADAFRARYRAVAEAIPAVDGVKAISEEILYGRSFALPVAETDIPTTPYGAFTVSMPKPPERMGGATMVAGVPTLCRYGLVWYEIKVTVYVDSGLPIKPKYLYSHLLDNWYDKWGPHAGWTLPEGVILGESNPTAAILAIESQLRNGRTVTRLQFGMSQEYECEF